jgi:hypothetical protein
MAEQNGGGGGGEGGTPVVLNVYDLTPMNNYLYWFGLGIFHSGIEGAYALTCLPAGIRFGCLRCSCFAASRLLCCLFGEPCEQSLVIYGSSRL